MASPSWLYRIMSSVTTIMGMIMTPILQKIFSWIYDGSSQSVPPIEDPILLSSATALAKRIRKQEVKAVDVMERFIGRVREVNPIVNGVVAERYELALNEAREVDNLLEKGNLPPEFSEENAPLLGVPVSVKEAFAVKGMPNTSGLVSRVGLKSDTDAVAVRNLKRAGAIPFVLTNTSEVCMWFESSNKVYGQSKNPYNTGRIVGGSSGGEGCLIGSGASVVGIGSDIGGSIRMPAFFNGIFGHKPSKGIVCNDGQFPPGEGGLENMLATGPMCRYAEDLIPMLKVFAGENIHRLNLDQPVDLKNLKIFSMENDGGYPFVSKVNSELIEAQRKVLSHMKTVHGCEAETVNINLMKYGLPMWTSRMSDPATPRRFFKVLGGEKGDVNPFMEIVKCPLGLSNHTFPALGLCFIEFASFLIDNSNDKLLSLLASLGTIINEMLSNNGVLLYPSHPKVAPYHNQPLTTPLDFSYTSIFNALELPVTQCPLGLSKEGLPLGVQVVTSLNNDRLSLAVAREIEKTFGGWVPPNMLKKNK